VPESGFGGDSSGRGPESPVRTKSCRAPITERSRPSTLPSALHPHVSRLQPLSAALGPSRTLREAHLRSTPSTGLQEPAPCSDGETHSRAEGLCAQATAGAPTLPLLQVPEADKAHHGPGRKDGVQGALQKGA
jgi:hypothetical protein